MYRQVNGYLYRVLASVITVSLFAFVLPGTAHADAGIVHLTGTVTSPSGGVPNVSVTATTPGGSTTLFGPSTTAAGGSYELDVDPGTYDLHFTPPPGSGLNAAVSANVPATTDQVLNVHLTAPTHVLSGTVHDGAGAPVPAVTLRFALVSTGSPVTATTDAVGHYSVTAAAGVYYLPFVTGGSSSPFGAIFLTSMLAAASMPHYDASTADVTQDFQVPTGTLAVTVKDGFGNPVPNAPVTILSTSAAAFPLTSTETPDYWNEDDRDTMTSGAGTATLTALRADYPPGAICATVAGTQICNTTTLTAGSLTNLSLQAAAQAPAAPTGLTATTPTAAAPSLTWTPVGNAASYRIYRGSQLAGTSTTPSFVDTALTADGSYSYTVTAISQINIESSHSAAATVIYSPDGPVVTNARVSPTSISPGQTAVLSATVSDALINVVAVEYFDGTDPGEGHGVAMSVAGSAASVTLPTNLSLGTHTFTIRAEDSLGSWTRIALPTAQLTVSLPTLNGRISNGANQGIANVRVDVVDPANHANVIATTTSGATGTYSVSAPGGTYDVIYTPSGGVYLATTKTGINLTTSATLDVTLVLVPTTFSGTLTDKFGTGISSATLTLRNSGGQTVTTTTAADGSFSAQVNPATYSLIISGGRGSTSAFIPASFSLSGGAFDLTADITQDFVINAVTATFTAKSALTGLTIANVGLNISTSASTTVYSGSGTYSGGGSSGVSTDAGGGASVIVLAGSLYSVTATPPAGAGVVTTSFPQAGPITADTSVDLALNADIRHFTGTFTDDTGTAIPGASVNLSGSAGSFHATTDATGSFDMTAAAGTYSLAVSGSKPSGSTLRLPDSFTFSGGSIDITSADKSQNLTFAAATVAVTAQSSFGVALAGVGITLGSVSGSVELYPGGSFNASASSTATTDATGVAHLLVTKVLAYTTKAIPAAGSGYLVTNLAPGSAVTADTAWTITLDRDLKNFSGTVLDKNGVAVTGATVSLDGSEQDQHYRTVTDSSGAFHLQVAPNSGYSLHISGTQAAAPAADLPDNFTLSGSTGVTADKVQNITVGAVNLDILTRNDALAPIAGVGITFSSGGSQNGFGASSSGITRTTGSDGHAQITMLTGTTYTISAVPPSGLGYVNTTITGTSAIVQDSQTIIEFQNHIPLAPTGLTAPNPTATSPALSWNAVANADHYNIYRGTTTIGTSITTSFTDTTLVADGSYPYRVSAVTGDGFEGPKSTSVTVIYDTTAPAVGTPALSTNPITAGSSTTLTVPASDAGPGGATSSGVASGEYFIGTDPGIGHGTAMTFASGNLTATLGSTLAAGTYQIGVRARDAAGTWSPSATITLTVSPVPVPVVTAISPANGSVVGGTVVTVTGTSLARATSVTFGSGHAGTSLSCTATSCTVTSPAGAAGTVDVQVITPGGTSATTAADRFTYTSAISYLAATGAASNAVSTTVTIPAAVDAGATMLLYATVNTNSAFTVPAGWHLIASTPSSFTAFMSAVWWRTATSTDHGTTVTVGHGTGIAHGTVNLVAYTGINATTPINAYNLIYNGTNPVTVTTTPTVNVSTAGTWITSYWACKSTSVTTFTAQASQATRVSTNDSGGGHINSVIADSATGVPAGTSGGYTAASDQLHTGEVAWTVALNPAS